ncbi:Penicillinase repressor [Pseudobythopirellula maris]|uniref:Penicillinase repressor n=1 Tax=Pseudobythopirellula maris TaxID=2527991 RepID=A0A5C5ZLF7_9BACT|nr:BlaI/MecI/CopY family transcriptional regulator [Pseudobythopirellula maris]TWT87651.1 Penicillinase repressor [Pseudobythopirellula maris]
MDSFEPTDRELDALKVLWDAVERDGDDASPGGATVREVVDRLNADGGGLAYTTVLSLLQVMEQKGLVDHTRRGKAYVYRPLVARKKTLGQIAGGFLEKVFDGAVHEYLVHAIDGRKLSSDELDELEAMIAAARDNQASRKKAKPSPSRKKGGK